MTDGTGKTNVGVFGLGSMGFGMATSLLRAGLPTIGFDVNAERCEAFAREGGVAGVRPAEEVPHLDVVVSVVVSEDQTHAILFGDAGIAAALKPGSVFVSCATVSPGFARRTATSLAERGIHYLDAPISGGAAKAAAGSLTIMAAGTREAFDRASAVLDAMAETVYRLGDEAGAGAAMKIVNQLLAGVHIAAACEAVTFGIRAGIDPNRLFEVISKCAGTSWMFENRVPHILDGDYQPRSAVDIFVKDLGIVTATAHRAKFPVPLASAALNLFLMASGAGHGGEDDSAVAKVYAANGGIELPKSK